MEPCLPPVHSGIPNTGTKIQQKREVTTEFFENSDLNLCMDLKVYSY